MRAALLLALLPALAACHSQTREKDERTATGQVLAGSISDSMIPYEALTSTPPAAPRVVAHGPRDAAAPDEEADAPADEATPAAAPSPSIGI